MGKESKKKTYVYVRSPKYCWIPAIQSKSDSSKATVSIPEVKDEVQLLSCSAKEKLRFQPDEVIDFKKEKYDNNVLPMQNVDANGNLEDYKDMVELPFMHEAAILYNLKLRHSQGKPYTRTGDIVFAVNPYKWYNDLYTDEKRTYYANRLVWDQSTEDPRAVMEPHVYEVSALSYKGLRFSEDHVNQSILVSGESGAGKTETVKICLNHIASVQRGKESIEDGSELDPVVQRVVESNPLLEAFGNAKTRRNDNSSRFGKYLQLQFTKDYKCKLVGSVCDVYLLEKSRIITHEQAKERNFHIFYQLLASSKKTEFWSELSGKTNDSFKYVGPTKTDTIEGMKDGDRFNETVDCLKLVGIKDDKLQDLMKTMCIVLQLGNLSFTGKKGDTDKSEVSTTKELKALASLMGIGEKELATALTERTFTTRNETHKVPLNVEQAKEASDAFAKEAYERSFLWLVHSINQATSATAISEAVDDDKHATIGMLDIFGFESFPHNGYEQLCINYANEKLQQKFNNDIFESVKLEYEAEGLDLADIYYDDNTDVLDLIEGKTGLLALLNEECVRPKGNDQDFVQKALQINKSSPCLKINKTDRMSFAIHHYAGIVMYDAEFFVAKNLDTLPTDLSDCMEKSSNQVIKTPKNAVATPSTRSKSNITAATVWTKYKDQLSVLMKNLKRTQSRYVRCVKPNNQKKPVIMEHEPVVDQLRCAGVVAAITISRSCFPNRLPNSVVMARYHSQWDESAFPSKRKSGMTLDERRSADCHACMDCLLKSKETTVNGKAVKAFVVGKTKTYFRSGALELLEANRSRGQDLQAIIIQRGARAWLARLKDSGGLKRQRQEAAERSAREKAEAEKRAQMAAKHKERIGAAKKKQDDLAAKIKEMEKQIKDEEQKGHDAEKEIKKECHAVEHEIKRLEKQQAEDLQEQLRQRKVEKAKQEKKLEQAGKLIHALKKENTKLRKQREKARLKLGKQIETSEKVEEMNNSLSNLADSFSSEADAVEGVYQTLKEEHDAVRKSNKELKAKVKNQQAIYMDIANHRVEYQRAMVKVLNMVQDHVKKRALQEEICNLAYAAEAESKAEMEALEVLTAGQEVSYDDFSETEGSSSAY